MSARRPPQSSQFLPLFTPQLGASQITALTAGATGSALAAIPHVDGTEVPYMMQIRGPAGGTARLAFNEVATALSWMIGFADPWEIQIGIPQGATTYSVIADTADVALEITWQ